MAKGEDKKAQDITQRQIDESRAQREMFNEYLKTNMSQRDSSLAPFLSSLFPQIQQLFASAGDNNAPDIGKFDFQNPNVNPEEKDLGSVNDISVGNMSVADMAKIAEGLSPEAMAVLRAQGVQQTGSARDQAMRAARTALTRHGGGMGYGGDVARLLSPIESQAQRTRAELGQQATLAGEQARREDVRTNVGIGQSNQAKDLAVGQANMGKDLAVGQTNQNKALQMIQAILANRGLANSLALGQGNINLGFQNAKASNWLGTQQLNSNNWLSGRQLSQNAMLGAIGANNSAIGNLANLYNPSPYISGSDSALGSETNATGQRAAIRPQSFWNTLGSAAIGGLAGVGGAWLSPGGIAKGKGK